MLLQKKENQRRIKGAAALSHLMLRSATFTMSMEQEVCSAEILPRVELGEDCVLRNKLVIGSARSRKPRITTSKTTLNTTRAKLLNSFELGGLPSVTCCFGKNLLCLYVNVTERLKLVEVVLLGRSSCLRSFGDFYVSSCTFKSTEPARVLFARSVFADKHNNTLGDCWDNLLVWKEKGKETMISLSF